MTSPLDGGNGKDDGKIVPRIRVCGTCTVVNVLHMSVPKTDNDYLQTQVQEPDYLRPPTRAS